MIVVPFATAERSGHVSHRGCEARSAPPSIRGERVPLDAAFDLHVMAPTRRHAALVIASFALLASLVAACGDGPAAPSSVPDPNLQVTPTSDTSGPIRLAFVSANIAPGSTVTGCGPFIEGCSGALRITLQLSPPADGPVLYVRIYLHSQRNGMACLWGETGPFVVRAGQPLNVEVPLGNADVCNTPETLVSMDGIVEGPVQVASRQVWLLHYVFGP